MGTFHYFQTFSTWKRLMDWSKIPTLIENKWNLWLVILTTEPLPLSYTLWSLYYLQYIFQMQNNTDVTPLSALLHWIKACIYRIRWVLILCVGTDPLPCHFRYSKAAFLAVKKSLSRSSIMHSYKNVILHDWTLSLSLWVFWNLRPRLCSLTWLERVLVRVSSGAVKSVC